MNAAFKIIITWLLIVASGQLGLLPAPVKVADAARSGP
jgi:hypothetical protein